MNHAPGIMYAAWAGLEHYYIDLEQGTKATLA